MRLWPTRGVLPLAPALQTALRVPPPKRSRDTYQSLHCRMNSADARAEIAHSYSARYPDPVAEHGVAQAATRPAHHGERKFIAGLPYGVDRHTVDIAAPAIRIGEAKTL